MSDNNSNNPNNSAKTINNKKKTDKMNFLYSVIENGWSVKKKSENNNATQYELRIPINKTTLKNRNLLDEIESETSTRRAISEPIIR